MGIFTGPTGTFRQTTMPITDSKHILATLNVTAPPRILHLNTNPS